MAIGNVHAQDGPDAGAAVAAQRIGEQLRAARLARGEHLPDVAGYLRIKAAHLAALEAGDLAAMPARPYAVGFLRTYAAHLGLNGGVLAAGLKSSAAPTIPRPASHRAAALEYPPVSAGAAASAAVLVAAAVWLAFGLGAPDFADPSAKIDAAPMSPPAAQHAAMSAETVPSFDAASAVAAEPSALAVLAAADSETVTLPEMAPTQGGVMLLGHAASWVQVRSEDRTYVRSGHLAAGGRLALPARSDLRLSTGDGGTIQVIVDGRSAGFLGASGAVVRDFALSEALGASAAPAR